jgi:hypothetical protein
VLDSERGGRRDRDDAIDLELDHLGSELWEALRMACREPALEDEVALFAIPALPQPVQQRLPQVGRWGHRRQVANPVDFVRGLRFGYERCQEEGVGDEEPKDTVLHRVVLQNVQQDHQPEGESARVERGGRDLATNAYVGVPLSDVLRTRHHLTAACMA